MYGICTDLKTKQMAAAFDALISVTGFKYLLSESHDKFSYFDRLKYSTVVQYLSTTTKHLKKKKEQTSFEILL